MAADGSDNGHIGEAAGLLAGALTRSKAAAASKGAGWAGPAAGRDSAGTKRPPQSLFGGAAGRGARAALPDGEPRQAAALHGARLKGRRRRARDHGAAESLPASITEIREAGRASEFADIAPGDTVAPGLGPGMERDVEFRIDLTAYDSLPRVQVLQTINYLLECAAAAAG